MFLEKLSQAAINKCGLIKDSPLLLGVSGGADSLALMDGLIVLEFNLVIAHLDHAIRPESEQDADFIEALAAKNCLPFVRKRVDVPALAEDEGLSLEEAARVVRYRFLFDQAQQHAAQAVAVAHHADDQVETVLMHFIRGAGLDGLSGMSYRRLMPQWTQAIPLVRPLLGVWREEIDFYLLTTGLSPRVDETNQDRTYFRNHLRHELIPKLETLNPQFRKIVCRTADVLAEENQYLGTLASSAWEDCYVSHTAEWVVFQQRKFITLPTALKRRVLRRAILLLRPGLRDIGFDAIERGVTVINREDVSSEVDLAAKLSLVVVGGQVIVKTQVSALPDGGKSLLPSADFRIELFPDDSVALKNGWILKMDVIDATFEKVSQEVQTLPHDEAWLDFDKLKLPLVLRGREPGERWLPLGMHGHSQKVKDFFINEKIPAHLRDCWPLIVSGSEVAWVVGVRPSESFKVAHKTRRILRLYLSQQ